LARAISQLANHCLFLATTSYHGLVNARAEREPSQCLPHAKTRGKRLLAPAPAPPSRIDYANRLIAHTPRVSADLLSCHMFSCYLTMLVVIFAHSQALHALLVISYDFVCQPFMCDNILFLSTTHS